MRHARILTDSQYTATVPCVSVGFGFGFTAFSLGCCVTTPLTSQTHLLISLTSCSDSHEHCCRLSCITAPRPALCPLYASPLVAARASKRSLQ